MNSHRLNENVAIYFLTKFIKEKKSKISGTLTVLSGGTATFKEAGELSRTIKTMKSIGTFSKTATGGTSFSITKPLEKLTEIEMTAFKNYSPIALGQTNVLWQISQGGLIIIHAIFIVWDIVSLVQDWTNNHPAVEVIDDVLRKLDDIEKHFNDE
jgi:hypothetical protein